MPKPYRSRTTRQLATIIKYTSHASACPLRRLIELAILAMLFMCGELYGLAGLLQYAHEIYLHEERSRTTMIILLSPAKTLDFDSKPVTKSHTQPGFLEDSAELISQLQDLSPADISSLMGVSDTLGELNFDRYQQWQTPFTASNAKQAVLAFKGDVYTGLEAETFSSADFKFAQKHLRILSGLYGMLRPLDLMQAYRLEMGVKFANDKGANLYQFWGNKLTEELNAQLKKNKSEVLVNLASNEYFKAVKKKNVDVTIVSPAFKDFKNGDYKMISFFAKKARGLMAAWIIKNKVTDSKELLDFTADGYKYNKKLSSPEVPVFTRKQ